MKSPNLNGSYFRQSDVISRRPDRPSDRPVGSVKKVNRNRTPANVNVSVTSSGPPAVVLHVMHQARTRRNVTVLPVAVTERDALGVARVAAQAIGGPDVFSGLVPRRRLNEQRQVTNGGSDRQRHQDKRYARDYGLKPAPPGYSRPDRLPKHYGGLPRLRGANVRRYAWRGRREVSQARNAGMPHPLLLLHVSRSMAA